LNELIRRDPQQNYVIFDCLLKNPEILDFENKKAFFDRFVSKDRMDYKITNLHISVQRGQEFMSTLPYIKQVQRNARIIPQFVNELGLGPGVAREVSQSQIFSIDLLLTFLSISKIFHVIC
jgi:hypothetical protein